MGKKFCFAVMMGLLFTYNLKAQLIFELGLGASYSKPMITNGVNTQNHLIQKFGSSPTPKFSIGYKINKFYPYVNLFRANSSSSMDFSADASKDLAHNIKMNYFNWYNGVGLMYQFYQRNKISMNAGIEFGTFKSNYGFGGNSNADSVAFVTTIPSFQNTNRIYTYGLKFQLEYTPRKNSIGLEMFYNRSFNTLYQYNSDFQIYNNTGSYKTQSKGGQFYIGINYKIYFGR